MNRWWSPWPSTPPSGTRVDFGDRKYLANEPTRLSDDNAERMRKIAASGEYDAHTGAIEKAGLGKIYHQILRGPSDDLFNALGQIGSGEDVHLTTDSDDWAT